MLNQKTAVFNTVCQVLGQDSFDGAVELTKEQRQQVIAIVAEGFYNGEVELSQNAAEKYDTIEKLKGYSNGLVSNWLRKDTRLNGGSKYEAKNPGSRAGSGDTVVRELKRLRSTLTDPSQIATVDQEIEKRLEAIKVEKAKKVEINADLLPEDLRALVS